MQPKGPRDDQPFVTMREFLERIIEEKHQQYETRFRASEIAVTAALDAQKTSAAADMDAQQTAMSAALAAAEKAVIKAEIATEKRFESVNEFRLTLSDQTKGFMPRSETMALFNAVEEKLTSLEKNYEDKLETLRTAIEKNADNHAKAQNEMRLAMSHLVTNNVFEARHAELQNQITALREYRSESTGKSTGANALWAIIAGVALLIVAIVSLIIALLPHIVTK